MGGKAPEFAHLPLLTGKEGKLSKRLGSLGVRELRADGVENMAICSFLAKLGTSEAIEPYFDLQTLANSLDFNKLGRSQPKFDEEELKLFNHKYVRQLSYDQVVGRVDVSKIKRTVYLKKVESLSKVWISELKTSGNLVYGQGFTTHTGVTVTDYTYWDGK